jgi:hypothetical protein
MAWSADLDQASQQLLADATSQQLPASQRPPISALRQTATTPALVNPALAIDEPPTTRRPGHPERAERTQPAPEPEPEPEA